MRIVWYGHSTFRLEFDGKIVLIDPFFTGNPAFKGDRDEAVSGATHILITHGHGDHIGDAVALSQATGVKVVTNFELCMWLARQGVTNFDPMNTGGTTDQGGFSVTLVRADHSSGLVEQEVGFPLGPANGIVVKAPGQPTLYHMGDTDVFGDMALIQELHAPDILLVPIGDRFTMGPDTAAFAVRRFFKPRAVIPCHYGSFPIIEPNADRFLAAMDGSGLQVVVPHLGMGVTL